MADLFGAVTDDAVNRIIGFAHARAPYLFNYVAPSLTFPTDASGKVVGIQELWVTCSPVPDPPPNVPKYRRMDPFPLPGIPIRLPYCIQIIELKLDFHPPDILTLPAELAPPLAAQHFALSTTVQFGLACVPPDVVTGYGQIASLLKERQLDILPVTELDCFVLKAFATGHLVVTPVLLPGSPGPVDQIRLEVDGIEIVDIAPPGLEHAVECFLTAMLRGYVLPKTVLALQQLTVNTLGIKSVTPKLTPGLANNPAIESNELRVSLDLTFT